MKSMKDLKYKKLRIKPLHFMLFMSFMVNISSILYRGHLNL